MTHMPELARRLCLPLLAAGLLVGCRTAQPKGAGALIVTPLYNPSAIPVYLGVDGPHLFGHGADAKVDFDLELQQDGCARGAVNWNPIEVCPVPGRTSIGFPLTAPRAQPSCCSSRSKSTFASAPCPKRCGPSTPRYTGMADGL